ncbi:MAG: DUF535 family protein [Burkholderiales bacterium]|nr:DUF535 family protein [Burkholderiales bacterium]
MSHIAWACSRAFPLTPVGVVKRTRLVIRSLMSLKASVLWFEYVRQSQLRNYISCEPNLLEAVHRPFFDHRICALERSHFLRSHFDSMAMHFSCELFQDVLLTRQVTLANLIGKNGEVFDVVLLREDAYKREGGMSLGLSLNGKRLLCLTFSMVKLQHELLIKVGGLQASNEQGRSSIKQATQALHGIQPRLLLIEALRTIAAAMQCQQIECVALENHIHKAWRYRFKKTIHAEYDQLWELAGGQRNLNGNFSIPLKLIERSIEDRPSNKRSEYRRRAAILNEMRAQMTSALSVPPYEGSLQLAA